MLLSKDLMEQEMKKWHNRLVKNCKKCNGEGTITLYNSNKGVVCDCQKKAMSNARLISCGIPTKYLDKEWDWTNINCPKEVIDKVKKYVDNFIQNYYDGQWIYLYGRQGRGKTLLESLTARDVIVKINPDTDKCFKVIFVIFEELIRLSHESRDDANIRKKYNYIIESTDLLILDNIGSETGTTSYNSKILEYILRKRDMNCVPTIISSNFSPEQIKEHYSDTIHDFIIQNSHLVLVEGENYRQKGNTLDDELDKDFFEDDN
jgi:DNA replication protein DnaC